MKSSPTKKVTRKAAASGESASKADTYIVLTFGYHSKFLLPMDAGLTIVKALEQANRIDEPYNKDVKVSPNAGEVSIEYVSPEKLTEYRTLMFVGDKS